MTDLSSRSVLVFDHGLFLETAIRLSREFGKVYYCTPWHSGFPRLKDAVVGDGFDEIEWLDDIFDVRPDLYVFPDVYHSALQLSLEENGRRVWGSRAADAIELKRGLFLRILAEVGLEVPKYETIVGLSELRDYLAHNPDCYVKISKFRGSMETFHHVNMALSGPILDGMAQEFGPWQEDVIFTIVQPIESSSEIGYDGYCVGGEFPSVSLYGLEVKDKAYIGSVKKYSELPEAAQAVNSAMAQILKDYRYANWWSTEIRVTDDGKAFFIDPTCRQPCPPGESELELYENLGEIMWEGGSGNLVDPEITNQFSVQVLIKHTREEYHTKEESQWRTLQIPESVRQWVKIRYASKNDDTYSICPVAKGSSIGWVVGVGDTIENAIEHAMDTCSELEGQQLQLHTEALADALKAVKESEESGIEFTDQPVPEPQTVIEKHD